MPDLGNNNVADFFDVAFQTTTNADNTGYDSFETDEPFFYGGFQSLWASAWFRFVAPATANYMIHTKNSTFDTQLEIYLQLGADEMTPPNFLDMLLAGADDGFYPEFRMCNLTGVAEGNVYFIRVGGKFINEGGEPPDIDQGAFKLTIQPSLAGDPPNAIDYDETPPAEPKPFPPADAPRIRPVIMMTRR